MRITLSVVTHELFIHHASWCPNIPLKTFLKTFSWCLNAEKLKTEQKLIAPPCLHSPPYLFWRKMVLSLTRPNFLTGAIFRAEKRKEHAWTFLPRSPGLVWKNGGISNILLPKNKTFPLITWKEQAICLQKLQAVVITLSLVNFLEEYLIVKRNLTTLIFLRCTGNVLA